MKEILQTQLYAIIGRFTKYYAKARVFLSPKVWKAEIIRRMRGFFSSVLDIKPKDKNDYYAVLKWLISKRLAFALIIGLGVAGIAMVWVNLPIFNAREGTIRTYRYNAFALKFQKGVVRILARGGHQAYIGEVSNGEVAGKGSLYRADESLLFEGEFQSNQYNGRGKLYHPVGTIRYEGGFSNNLYDGEGKQYRPNGVIEYSGGFSRGMRSGQGILYNGGGNVIYTGTFMCDNLVFSEMVGKKTTEVSQKYTGKSDVYSTTDEYCVSMEEIRAVYAIKDGSERLDEEWIVDSVCVLGNSFPIADRSMRTINELTAFFGSPIYFGSTYLNLTEVVAADMLSRLGGNFITPKMNTTERFEDLFHVNYYNRNTEVYIYTFEQGGLIYTFYCADSISSFQMYSIAQG